MVDVLAHPFHLDGDVIAVVDDASDAGIAQEIAMLLATHKGERQLVPDYGITDPVFDQPDVAEINAAIATYGPEGLVVTDLDVEPVDGNRQRVVLHYTTAEE